MRTQVAMMVSGAILVAAFAAAVTASTPAGSPAIGTPPPPVAAGASTLKPIDPAALQAMVDQSARELMVPGALVLVRTPQGEITARYGTTQIGAARLPTADTQFRIASNTKTMTAAVILLLAQEGKLGLDDPLSKYVPDVPNGDHISIAELLRMRSGLYNYTDAPELAATLDREPTKVWSPSELLAIAFKRPANFAPGTAYEYNNTNYALLGLVAEKLDGKPLAQVMQDRLFTPLGMRHTALPAAGDNTLPDPAAHGYGYGGTAVVLSDASGYSPELQAQARAGAIQPTDYTGLNHSFAAAAGGVVSTANDLAIWIRALATGGVLDAAAQRRWLDGLLPENSSDPNGQQYGYGISQLRWGPNAVYFHGGETPGFNSKIVYDPANQMTLVVWTNMAVSLDEQQPANTLMVKVLDQIYQQSPLSTGR